MPETYNPETGEVTVAPFAMPKEIAGAIVAVKAKVRAVGYDEKNPHGGYPYVSVDKLYSIIGPLMAEASLFLVIDEVSSEVKEGARGNPWLFVSYELRFAHASGAVSSPVRRSLAQPISGPQTYGAAQSYIEKQYLRQVFKIPTGEKDADVVAQDEAAPAQKPFPVAVPAKVQQPLGMVPANATLASVVGNGKAAVAAKPNERAELQARVKVMRDAIAEADAVGLAAIEDSQDLAELGMDLMRVLGEEQGKIQVKQLNARITTRRNAVLPGYEV